MLESLCLVTRRVKRLPPGLFMTNYQFPKSRRQKPHSPGVSRTFGSFASSLRSEINVLSIAPEQFQNICSGSSTLLLLMRPANFHSQVESHCIIKSGRSELSVELVGRPGIKKDAGQLTVEELKKAGIPIPLNPSERDIRQARVGLGDKLRESFPEQQYYGPFATPLYLYEIKTPDFVPALTQYARFLERRTQSFFPGARCNFEFLPGGDTRLDELIVSFDAAKKGSAISRKELIEDIADAAPWIDRSIVPELRPIKEVSIIDSGKGEWSYSSDFAKGQFKVSFNREILHDFERSYKAARIH